MSPTPCEAICRQVILCILSLGFIFYKYLSERIEKAVDTALIDDGITFKELWQSTDEDAEELKAEVRNQCMDSIGYFIEPEFLFSSIICVNQD